MRSSSSSQYNPITVKSSQKRTDLHTCIPQRITREKNEDKVKMSQSVAKSLGLSAVLVRRLRPCEAENGPKVSKVTLTCLISLKCIYMLLRQLNNGKRMEPLTHVCTTTFVQAQVNERVQ